MYYFWVGFLWSAKLNIFGVNGFLWSAKLNLFGVNRFSGQLNSTYLVSMDFSGQLNLTYLLSTCFHSGYSTHIELPLKKILLKIMLTKILLLQNTGLNVFFVLLIKHYVTRIIGLPGIDWYVTLAIHIFTTKLLSIRNGYSILYTSHRANRSFKIKPHMLCTALCAILLLWYN